MSNRLKLGVACAGIALLAGCHKTPSGQVAATVDGKEVTLQEVNTELQAMNLPPTVDKTLAQKAALQRVIERKLLVEAAEKKGIDKSPEYLAEKRRQDELLLAQTYARQQLAAIPMPTDAQVNKFMADHPTAFANRERLLLEQIRFAPPKDPKQLQVLSSDHSLDAVAQHLTAMGIKFERGNAAIDTAQAPPEVITQIEKLPAGEPFVVPSPGVVTVSVIKGQQPIPTDPAQAKSASVGAWRQQQFSDLLGNQIKTMKDTAKISYQNGFGPPPANGAPAATPAKK